MALGGSHIRGNKFFLVFTVRTYGRGTVRIFPWPWEGHKAAGQPPWEPATRPMSLQIDWWQLYPSGLVCQTWQSFCHCRLLNEHEKSTRWCSIWVGKPPWNWLSKVTPTYPQCLLLVSHSSSYTAPVSLLGCRTISQTVVLPCQLNTAWGLSIPSSEIRITPAAVHATAQGRKSQETSGNEWEAHPWSWWLLKQTNQDLVIFSVFL